MTNTKFVRERHMNKVIMSGQSEAMDEIQDRLKELTVLFDRNTKLSKKIEQQEKTKVEADSQLQELTKKLKIQEEKAEKAGLDLDEVDKLDDEGLDSNASKSAAVYDRKSQVLEQAIEVQGHKYGKELGLLHDKLRSILETQNESVASIKLRQSEIIEKRKEFNELMVKSKLKPQSEGEGKNELDETLAELPDEVDVEGDRMVCVKVVL